MQGNSSYNLATGAVEMAMLNRGCIRKEQTNADGYAYYGIYDNVTKKYYTVFTHHIVMILADAEGYIGHMADGMTINHINGDKTYNSLGNLEYLTPAQNSTHAYVTGLLERPLESQVNVYQAYGMLEAYYQQGKSLEELSNAFNLPLCSARNILRGKAHRGMFSMFKSLNRTDVRRKTHKLNVTQTRQILDLYYNKGIAQAEIAKQFNISRSTVGMIATGARWADIHEEFMREMP